MVLLNFPGVGRWMPKPGEFVEGTFRMENEIGRRIEEVRGTCTQAEFATQLGVHKNTIGRIERGERTPDAEFLRALYRGCGINPTWVLTGRGDKYVMQGEVLGAAMAEALGMTGLGTAAEQAAMLGIDEDTLLNYLAGTLIPDRAFLERFAERTGYPMDKLQAALDVCEAVAQVNVVAATVESKIRAQQAQKAEEPPRAPVVGAIVAGEIVEADELRKLVAHVNRWEKELNARGVHIDADLKAEIIVFAWAKVKNKGYDAGFVNSVLKLALS